MPRTIGRVRSSGHLSGIVDARSVTVSPTQCTEVSHPHAIGTGDEGMVITISRARISGHLSDIIDTRGTDVASTQRTKVSHPHAIGTCDEDVLRIRRERISDHLPGIVDTGRGAVNPTQYTHAIGARDETVADYISCHLSGVVDATDESGVHVEIS